MRTYERTHPWLKFEVSLESVDPKVWMLLGEARSKCDHIAGVPLEPEVAKEFLQIYLARGVAATTAIEGNTLTPRQAALRIEGKPLEVSDSKAYQVKEIDNIIEALNLTIGPELVDGSIRPLTTKRIMEFNYLVLKGLALERDVVPGQIRKHQVGITGAHSHYRGAPPEDCEYLLDRLCSWLNGPSFDPGNSKELAIPVAIIKAVLAHLYIELIHPFGDGNGRTGRLAELQILAMAGVPQVACHLLSNHYNETRPTYYQELQRTSETRGDVRPFLTYAVSGLVEGLNEQVARIRVQQWDVAWRNFVYDTFKKKSSSRARDLLLELGKRRQPVSRKDLTKMSTAIALAYADTTEKTLSRDLNALESLDLIVRENGAYRAKKEIILAFLPFRHDARKQLLRQPVQQELLGLEEAVPDPENRTLN